MDELAMRKSMAEEAATQEPAACERLARGSAAQGFAMRGGSAVPGLTVREVAAFLRSREGIYNLLSRLFRKEPSDASLAGLEASLPDFEKGSAEASAVAELRACLQRRDADSVRTLRGEYAHLFVGAGVVDLKDMASPYESTYTSDEHLLMQDARDEMVRLYREEGLAVSGDVSEPEDHVSFELAFSGVLSARAADALDEGNVSEAARIVSVLRSFYADHLSVWLGPFCFDVVRLATCPFFRASAKMLAGFATHEPVYLACAHATLDADAAPFEGESAVMDEALEKIAACEAQMVLTDAGERALSEEEKRVAADTLFRDMAFLKRYFVKVLQFCETPRATCDLEAETARIMQYKKTAYRPSDVRYMLARAFCIERIETPIATVLPGDERETGVTGAVSDESATGEGESVALSPLGTSASTADEGEQCARCAASEDAAESSRVLWRTTDIGREHIREEDPAKAIRDLLAKTPKAVPGYRDVLKTIKEGTGAFPEIEKVIKATDLYRVDNYHASMFLKRLEDAGAIEWRGAWKLSSSGERTLAELLKTA